MSPRKSDEIFLSAPDNRKRKVMAFEEELRMLIAVPQDARDDVALQ
jgi:hypothetical protein